MRDLGPNVGRWAFRFQTHPRTTLRASLGCPLNIPMPCETGPGTSLPTAGLLNEILDRSNRDGSDDPIGPRQQSRAADAING